MQSKLNYLWKKNNLITLAGAKGCETKQFFMNLKPDRSKQVWKEFWKLTEFSKN